ncbi:MAG: PrpF domain-containing protein [Acidimicrobiia bacterium]|nr:MAG: PrpF domain-containing protein [Acidimicrobiia bacterium]
MSDGAEQRSLPFVLMRGGTSKAVFLKSEDLPPFGVQRDRLVLEVFGSPDPRQVDGLGGADILTSKLAVIGPPSIPGADLDYTFGQVSITEPVVDYDINCGNISAAVGSFAVDEGLVPVVEPVTVVRIHNTNTSRVLVARVPVRNGKAAVRGEFAMDGVPGTGAAIALDYSRTAGGLTGALLPTGNTRDRLETEFGPVDATIVDLANLCVFVAASAVGMTGAESPGDTTDLSAVQAVKEAAARLIGVSFDGLTPIPTMVASPVEYTAYGSGERIAAADVDLVARVIGGRPPMLHKAYPGTVGACTAVAACLPGSVVAEVTRPAPDGLYRIGHTSGMMEAVGRVLPDGDGWVVEQASYDRTARRLAEGRTFVRRDERVPSGT